MKRLLYPILLLTFVSCSTPQKTVKSHRPVASLDRREYIATYRELAIKEMQRTGVPASITMAQALLESDNGNSTLAREGNNHFGIKCHSSWRGKRIYHDDDRRNECFRQYKSVYESYRDHSDFLVNGRRYAFLFSYAPNDYNSWAKGLQKAGYATSKTYARMLIKIIEDNDLHQLDEGKMPAYVTSGATQVVAQTGNLTKAIEGKKLADVDEFTISIGTGRIKTRNRIEYIVVRKGETLASLTRTFEKLPWELAKYNELSPGAPLEAGQIIFLQPKRNRAEAGSDFHIVAEGETLYEISQQYGIKLDKLRAKNHLKNNAKPQVGSKLWLRKEKP